MAGNPDDQLDFFGADIGPTRTLAAVAANAVSTAGTATTDPGGTLPPGRYLIQCTPPGGTDIVFVGAVPFKKGDVSWQTQAAAAPNAPLIRSFIEINVRKGHNDRIYARTTGGTSSVFVTQITRVPQKTAPA